MKHIFFSWLIFPFSVFSAFSQLTIIPRIGIEVSNTRTSINGKRYSNLLPATIRKQISVRADYQFKNSGSGVFAGVSTSNSILVLATDGKSYTAKRGSTQTRIEFGYQYTTYLEFPANKKSGSVKTANTTIRFQDQFGFACIPNVRKNGNTTGKGGQEFYSYNAGNWNLALIAAWGIEISKGNRKRLNIGFQYLKGLTNLGVKKFTNISENQTSVTTFSSRASSWSLNLGIPFTLRQNQ